MATTDPRIDAYIARSAPFARPILQHLRELVHKACPEARETIKWGFPHFEYNGAILCSMAAFKQHSTFGFWKASLMKDPEGILQVADRHSMGHFDRITTLKDLPADKILIAYIKQAALLNEEGVKLPPRPAKAPKKELPVPAELTAALKKNKAAQATFAAFPPSHRYEYIEWITEAKTDETKQKRVATTLEWLTEGKSRNWKYQKK
ncbi:MAG TPA: YdeI/OmpD-associated family protein [Puia sp.]|jgi:uncharacterized protein YdeI (YjbR/CyaY-like superfamily)|nr:YdeI/OmpD-associated family protein [Puia sp.]